MTVSNLDGARHVLRVSSCIGAQAKEDTAGWAKVAKSVMVPYSYWLDSR